jgi:hypothetical protein
MPGWQDENAWLKNEVRKEGRIGPRHEPAKGKGVRQSVLRRGRGRGSKLETPLDVG